MYIKNNKIYIHTTEMSDMSITVNYITLYLRLYTYCI